MPYSLHPVQKGSPSSAPVGLGVVTISDIGAGERRAGDGVSMTGASLALISRSRGGFVVCSAPNTWSIALKRVSERGI